MIHTHENTGAPTPEDVAAVLKEAREKAPNARIRIGQLEDFYDALMKENPSLPVVKGDMPDTWIHGYMSMPKEVKINKAMPVSYTHLETEVGRIHEGMPIKLTVGALDSRTFDATLEYVAPKGVEENGAVLFEIKAAVQMPEDAFIRAGYSANAEIVLKRATDVLTVPESLSLIHILWSSFRTMMFFMIIYPLFLKKI